MVMCYLKQKLLEDTNQIKGHFANQLNYMDFHKAPYKKGRDNVSLDNLIHSFLLGEIDFNYFEKDC